MSVPNQKRVIIKKAPCDKDNLYSVTNQEVELAAMRDLKDGAFRMWRYFSMNQNNYSFDLSQTAISKVTGVSRSTYYRAIDELMLKGYLIAINKNSNIYHFTEVPFQFETGGGDSA